MYLTGTHRIVLERNEHGCRLLVSCGFRYFEHDHATFQQRTMRGVEIQDHELEKHEKILLHETCPLRDRARPLMLCAHNRAGGEGVAQKRTIELRGRPRDS